MEYHQLKHIENKVGYVLNMRQLLKRGALFSDGTADYREPAEPEKNGNVTIKFRAAKDNLDYLFLVSDSERYLMKKSRSEELFDYYEVNVQLGEEVFYYCFEIYIGNSSYYYDKRGLVKNPNRKYSFDIIPGFSTPSWAKGAVFYQIYVDRFYNGDKSNDVESREYVYINEYVNKVDDWNRYPKLVDIREFYGGDLQGVMEKLDYLQELGIEAIYFNPLFVSPSNHKYDIQDYDYIDPHIGKIVEDTGAILPEGVMENRMAEKYVQRVTSKANLEASNELFALLTAEIHRRGMKVILDGVFNHCGSFNKWMDRERIYENQEGYDKGAFITKDSPYNGFFKFNEEKWPYNTTYDGWWQHDTLPKLNYEQSQELEQYILAVAKKWLLPPYNVDGWRLDVAADLGYSEEYNHKFWEMFRDTVKSVNPQALILAEHYGDASSWLDGKQWDSVMNYDAFMEPVTWFLTGMEKHSDDYKGDMIGNSIAFVELMIHYMAQFTTSSLQIAMNQLSNHDHSRFLTRTNHKVGRVAQLGPQAASEGIDYGIYRIAVIMQMTWPGSPTLYYGDETGVCGFTDPDNRRTFPWDALNYEMIEFHREAIKMHKDNPVLSHGSLKFLCFDKDILVYSRFNQQEQVIVIINIGLENKTLVIPVWETGAPKNSTMQQLICTKDNMYSIGRNEYPVQGGYLYFDIAQKSSIVLSR